MGEKKKKELKAVNPMLFLVAIILIVAVASYIVPAGSYDRVYDAAIDREIVDPSSYHTVDRNPISLFTLLMSVSLGIQNAAYIIAFLLVIGGMFAILNGTKAIETGMANVVRAMKGKELLMIPVCMLVFGYGGAITNAFTTGVAQSIAGLPMFSGMNLRVPLFLCLLAVSICYVTWHARRVKKNPTLSSTYEIDRITAQNLTIDTESGTPLTTRQKLTLVVFIIGLALTVWGIVNLGFGIDELSGIFLAIGIIGGLVGGLRPSEICDHFEKGCGNMLFPCLMIGLANSVVILLQEANIMDAIIHFLSSLLNGLPPTLAACGMFVVQDLFNVLVPSGSGQAAITMPIMAPLADMLGITRQTSVLAFQLGDAFTNVMAPTGGEILAALAMCGGVSFKKWAKYLFPLFLMWWVVAFIFLAIAVQIGYGPF